jgi:hypothetical protein
VFLMTCFRTPFHEENTGWRSSWTTTSKRPVSATRQALFCFRPPWAKLGSYRAGRSCAHDRGQSSQSGLDHINDNG